jgi:chorismate mutase
MPCRGIRGATSVASDTAEEILTATRELLAHIVEANQVRPEDIASVLFTVTPDLSAAFPARAARELGWQHVPLLDAQEVPVPGSLPRCIRVLLHWNTATAQEKVRHVYLRDAASLRPDLAAGAQAEAGGPTPIEPS